MAMNRERTVHGCSQGSSGFGMIEFMIASAVLLIGLVGVLALFAHTMISLSFAEQNVIAKQKTREAMESIFTARNTAQVSFAQIQNVSTGGIFLNGFQPLRVPGADGLIGTADDGAIETMVSVGNDGIAGTSDDKTITLNSFQRQMSINSINADLRQITITLRYGPTQGIRRDYQVVSYVSRYR
jgi:hypothetical protein